MSYKEAINLLQSKNLSEEEKLNIMIILNKKTKVKFFFSLTLFLSIFVVSTIFILLRGSRFTENYLKGIYIVLLATIISALIIYYLHHKKNENNFNHYLKMYKTFDLTNYIFIIVGAFLFIQMFVVRMAEVRQGSMLPTLKENDKVIVLQWPQKYYVNDIVVVDTKLIEDYNNDSYYVKRIKGVPNSLINYIENEDETITLIIDDYQEIISNVYYIENIKRLVHRINGVIPEGMYFILGDNSKNSVDSRLFGLVSEKAILGKVKFRVYPNGGKLN